MTEVPLARIFDGKKFLWDGEEYESQEEATAVEQNYRSEGFDVQRVALGSKALLYTRRLVSSSETPEQ
jgi:hypothetical protein